MVHPKDVGDKSTLAIMLALRETGFGVLVPFGENTRYDLVIDDGSALRRVQCKTGRLRRGAVVGVYLIPMTDLPIRVRGALRVDPPKNCQVKFIRYAATYEIGRVKVHAPDSVSD